ncbi:MAG: hypothetical protein HRU37_09675 [Roseibacillus sp.]|nr:hypothetical protein [Roseibacillus sp.]
MKLLLMLGASLTLSVAAQTDGESSPPPATPSTNTQPLPRAKAVVPEKGAPASRLGDSFVKRRAHIAEARKKARARARASKKKPEAAKLVLPAESASDATLPGTWVLQNESLGKSLTEQFQEAAGKGATFKLGKLDGHYLAEINPEDSKITVKWNEWKMESVTTRGDIAVTLTVTVKGTQEYEIVQLTSGTKPEGRKLLVKLVKDDTTSESFFQGSKMRTKVDLPKLRSGHWALHEGLLYLQGSLQKEAWKFDRKSPE